MEICDIRDSFSAVFTQEPRTICLLRLISADVNEMWLFPSFYLQLLHHNLPVFDVVDQESVVSAPQPDCWFAPYMIFDACLQFGQR